MTDHRSSMVREGWVGPGRRDSQIRPLEMAEDGLQIETNQRGTYEWWYFDAHLDTGHTIVIFFHASNPNPGLLGKTGIEFVLLDPDGQRTQHFFPYRKSEFLAAADRPDVRIGKNRITASQDEGELPVYEIYVDEPGLGCRLRYAAEVYGWKPGTGYSHFGDMGYFAWIVPVPRALVTGTVRVGQQTLKVSGSGYHDHNWLNFQFQRIINYWMWGRIYSRNYTLAYAYIQCNDRADNHAVKVLMLAHGSEVVISTGEFEFETEDFVYDARAKHHYPSRIKITANDEFEVSLNVKEVLEAQDLLDNYNPVLRFLAKHLLRLTPGYFRLASEFILAVNQADETLTERGTTLHEIVIFNPILQDSSEA